MNTYQSLLYQKWCYDITSQRSVEKCKNIDKCFQIRKNFPKSKSKHVFLEIGFQNLITQHRISFHFLNLISDSKETSAGDIIRLVLKVSS